MKKIFYISILLLFFTACEKSFLDTKPTDSYIQETFWKTKEQVESGLNGTYAVLNNTGFYGGITPISRETLSPNNYAYNNDNNLILSGNQISNTATYNSAWNASYRGIGRANTLLVNIVNVPMDSTLKRRYIAEGKFLRALYYFPLWHLFGGAPLILDEPDFTTQSNLPRNTAAELLTQILQDLNAAIVDLPASYGGTEKGRATKGAALALKARALLYAGRWSEAAAAAKAVIDSKTYTLFNDYRGLFFLENEGNSEVIFDIQYKIPEFGTGTDVGLDAQNTSAPTPDLVKDYYAKDGLPIATSPLYSAASPYANRDPRLQATFIVPGSLYKGKTVTATQYPRTGFGQKKYTIYKDNEVPAKSLTSGESELNYILIRYADVLLMYAEAQNEAAGPDATVYTALNLIRKRAGMPDFVPGLTKDEMRKEIRHERRVELAGEGLYYYDVLRWRTAEQVLNADVFNASGQRVDTRSFIAPRDYLWPVPALAIQETPALTQNPGWQ
ncbi:MAG TPA: RagB/SusD family nutrient uptake outer membrane protein [Segetibacter sp.]